MQAPYPWHLGSDWREVITDTTTIEVFLGLAAVGEFDVPSGSPATIDPQSAQGRASATLRQISLLTGLQRAVEPVRVMTSNREADNDCR